MTNDNAMPKMISEKSIQKPFGKRFFDSSIYSKKFRSRPVFAIVVSIMSLVLIFFWKKLPKNFISSHSISEISLSIEKITGQVVLVPPLVLKIKIESSPYANGKYKPSKISVVSFIGNGVIPPGAETFAVLLSGATNGMVKAQLTEALKVDGVSLLDAGTLLIGEGQSSDERLFVRFNKAVFKNGKFIRISAQGYDISDKIVGLKGSRVGDYTMKLAASSGLYFLSGLASGMKTEEIALPGQGRRPRMGDAALQGVSTAAGEQAKQYLEQMKNKAPLIEVKSGSAFIVTFDGSEQ
jgi:Bacterial conjugation TrbI-like protein